jgi:diacylglycerol kinase (ATP)
MSITSLSVSAAPQPTRMRLLPRQFRRGLKGGCSGYFQGVNDLTGVIAIAVLAVVAIVVALVSSRSGKQVPVPMRTPPTDPAAPAPRDRQLAAVIVNPTKFDDLDQVRATLARVCEERGWQEPILIETTEDDNGTGQAREGIERGADLICALGGDGTVRAVAAALVDSDVPLGLLPGGTGNLLARNLDLPIDDIAEAFRVALDGDDRPIDIGTINVVVPGDTQDQPKDYVFLVMAGVGFDADVMAQAPEDLKAHLGWAAYLVSGLKNLDGPRFGVRLAFDGKPAKHRDIRSIIVGNCGRLQGGVELLPDAEVDDGALDAVVLSPKGVVGWAGVGASILTKHRKGHPRVEHHRCERLTVTLDQGQEVQLDGDHIGPGLVLTFGVRQHALVVRVVPQPTDADAADAADATDTTGAVADAPAKAQ